MLSPGGAFLPLLPNNVTIVSTPKYNFIENVNFGIGKALYSIAIRIKRILNIKRHNAETLWKCIGWAYKIPVADWDIVCAYQQGVPTYLLADKFECSKKIAWVNADIFSVGYNKEYNRNFYKKIDTIVPVSLLLKEKISREYPEFFQKFSLIYDILNSDTIYELSKQQVLNIRRADAYIIATVGRLVHPKGYDLAVMTANILKESGLKFVWYFIGEGPERAHVERLISELGLNDEVKLLGMQLNPYSFISQADLYVQTSRSEGFGLTIAEAKILGKPIVSTNFDVVYNQLTHEHNGLIADMTCESIAENIIRFISDTALRSSIIATVNKERYITDFTQVKKVEQLLDLDNEN